MTDKRFSVENVMGILMPLFVIEVFLLWNIVLVIVVLQAFGVI